MNKKNILGYLLTAIAIIIVSVQYYRYRIAPGINWSKLNLQKIDGNQYEIDFKNSKYTAVSFFATWCGQCINEFATIENSYNTGSLNEINFIAITDESDDRIILFLQNHHYTHIKFLKTNQSLSNYGIKAFPTNYLMDRKGNLLIKKVGSIHWDNELEKVNFY